MRSMTGYGRGECQSERSGVIVEIQSLNRRFFDLQLQIPSELTLLESQLRGWEKEAMGRGKVTVRVQLSGAGEFPMVPNLMQVKQMKQLWAEIGEECGFPLDERAFWQMVAHHHDLLMVQEDFVEESGFIEVVRGAFKEAMAQVNQMMENEGQALLKDFQLRVGHLKSFLGEIEVLFPQALEQWKGRLEKKIGEWTAAGEELKERLSLEVINFVDKGDITEEVVRCKAHFNEFEQLLVSEEREKGKRLEFFLQEFLREVNTLSSKSQDAEISARVIAMKSEIEKMREQVQNIE